MYAFQSKSALYSCLNVKELLARNRRNIWSLSDCNRTLTHKHLVCKRTLKHLTKLAKWLGCVVSTYLYDAAERGGGKYDLLYQNSVRKYEDDLEHYVSHILYDLQFFQIW